MALLSKDAILQAEDLPYEDVYVKAWNGTVRVRALNGTERDAFEASCIKQQGNRQTWNLTNIRARLVSLALVDEAGNRMFTEAEAKRLGEKSAVALSDLFEVARKLSGISDADVSELVAGFGPAQNGRSTSG